MRILQLAKGIFWVNYLESLSYPITTHQQCAPFDASFFSAPTKVLSKSSAAGDWYYSRRFYQYLCDLLINLLKRKYIS